MFEKETESRSETHWENEDISPVSNDELKGFYGFSVSSEGFAGVGVAVFFPILLNELASANAVAQSNRNLPCASAEDKRCDVQIFGAYIDTSSLVLCNYLLTQLLHLCRFSSNLSCSYYSDPWRTMVLIEKTI
jgi:UMF1 family MFS transporter